MRNMLIFIAIIIATIVLIYSFQGNATSQPTEVSLSEIITLSQQDQISNIEVNQDKLTITKVDGTKVITYKEPNSNISDLKTVGLKLDNVNVDVTTNSGIPWGSILSNVSASFNFGWS